MFFQKFLTVTVGGLVVAAALYWDFSSTGGWRKDSPGRGLLVAVAVAVYAHYEWMRYDAKARETEIEGAWWVAAVGGPIGFWTWCCLTRGWKGLVNVAVSIPIYATFPFVAYTIYYVTRT